MEALRCYGASDSDSDSPGSSHSPQQRLASQPPPAHDFPDSPKRKKARVSVRGDRLSPCLPPPPADLLTASNSSCLLQMNDPHRGRIRSFPHVVGNYALHVYIPVLLSSLAKGQLEPFVREAISIAPELQFMEFDTPGGLCHDDKNIQGLSLAKEYHISLSRTVPILIHQIDSIVSMLQHKFICQKGYCLELDYWEVFVNDDKTRAFLSPEVTDKGYASRYHL